MHQSQLFRSIKCCLKFGATARHAHCFNHSQQVRRGSDQLCICCYITAPTVAHFGQISGLGPRDHPLTCGRARVLSLNSPRPRCVLHNPAFNRTLRNRRSAHDLSPSGARPVNFALCGTKQPAGHAHAANKCQRCAHDQQALRPLPKVVTVHRAPHKRRTVRRAASGTLRRALCGVQFAPAARALESRPRRLGSEPHARAILGPSGRASSHFAVSLLVLCAPPGCRITIR